MTRMIAPCSFWSSRDSSVFPHHSINLSRVVAERPRHAGSIVCGRPASGGSAGSLELGSNHRFHRTQAQPELLIVDGGSGLDAALAAVWNDVPVQRCTVNKHHNLLAHAVLPKVPISVRVRLPWRWPTAPSVPAGARRP
jgi:hypothetical protein